MDIDDVIAQRDELLLDNMAMELMLRPDKDEVFNAAIEDVIAALEWYIDEDETVESMEGNEYWVAGKHRAEAAAAHLRLCRASRL